MYQKFVAVGNLGGDPEMRFTQTGTAVTNFSLATNRKWTGNDGETHEETTWIRVSTWGKLAEVCNQYLTKGKQVLVEGRLNSDPETGGPRIWTDSQGNARASWEINAYEVKFLGGSGQSNSNGNSHEAAAPQEQDFSDDWDE